MGLRWGTANRYLPTTRASNNNAGDNPPREQVRRRERPSEQRVLLNRARLTISRSGALPLSRRLLRMGNNRLEPVQIRWA